MSTAPSAPPNLDRYVVIHVATTCDEHGVYVTKDSAEVIELGWILLDAKTCDEVLSVSRFYFLVQTAQEVVEFCANRPFRSSTEKAFL